MPREHMQKKRAQKLQEKRNGQSGQRERKKEQDERTHPACIAGLNTGLADVDSDALTHGFVWRKGVREAAVFFNFVSEGGESEGAVMI